MSIRKKSRVSGIFSNDLIIPVVLVLSYTLAFFIIRGSVPTGHELINDFSSIYARFGYYIIFISALLEALVVLSFFVPGLLGMSMGALFARTGHTQLSLVILTASLGLIIGYTIDFLLGRFGFSRLVRKIGYGRLIDIAHQKLIAYKNRGLLLGFIYPNIAAFLSLVTGTAKHSFVTFLLLSVLGTLFWVSLWAVLIFFIGDIFLKVFTNYFYILIIIGVGIFFFVQNRGK